ncbi:MAG: phytanoyl-CoA dioxygenase family protein [bacterium]|nr:phytanoyl-CoA dioxygenase [Planctomycetota bacterium]HIL51799.1 phytanoyl-CoA dioxygenase [Planctomycetota bacterium]
MAQLPSLSAEEVAVFRARGVLPLPGLFTDWVDILREGVEENLRSPGPFCTDSVSDGEGRFFDDYCNWERIPGYKKFALESPCAAIAAQAMQSRARLFHEHLVMKSAGTAQATPWHHDISYYCVQGQKTASIWIALDQIPSQNAVKFVAGSHANGTTYFPRKFLDGRDYDYPSADYASVPDIDARSDEFEILSWATQPGDAVLFHFNTLHATSAAPLEGPRRAIAWRWLGEDVRFHKRPGVTSPPYPDLALNTGDALPEAVFPFLG